MSSKISDIIASVGERGEPVTIDAVMTDAGDASHRDVMRAMLIWRTQRWLSAPRGREKIAYEEFLSGVLEDSEILMVKSELAASEAVEGRVEHIRAAMDERMAYWIRRAMAVTGAIDDSPVATGLSTVPAITMTETGSDETRDESEPASLLNETTAKIIPMPKMVSGVAAQESATPGPMASTNEARLIERAEEAEAMLDKIRSVIVSVFGGDADRPSNSVAARRRVGNPGGLSRRISRNAG